jgi:hypothetical protein
MPTNTLVRNITAQDDFEQLLQMMNDTAKRLNPDPLFMGSGTTVQDLKENYTVITNNGFVAEENATVVGFMGVSLSPITKNGYIEFGCMEGYEYTVAKLMERCQSVIRVYGGEKIYKFALSKFGQIRNKEITFWEQVGFTSEEYSNIILCLDIRDWNEPNDFHNTNISPVSDEELEEIKQILIEDGEISIAETVHNTKKEKVILTMRDEKTNDVLGLAYYFIDLVNRGTENEFYDAFAFTLHFRSRYNINKEEMRRLLHAALLSTKQLGVLHVITRITLKNFANFALMIREGFDEVGIDKNCIVKLLKTV